MPNKSAPVSAYPLQWPANVQRTPSHKRSKPQFAEKSWGHTLAEIQRQVKLFDGRYATLSTNQPLRQDGMPYASYRKIEDPGVALYFELDGEQVCFPCDRWVTLGLNMRAIAMNLDAMRAMQRWGVGTVKQQFTGYKALAAENPTESWWDVLDCLPQAGAEVIQMQYRQLAKAAHPDLGGSAEAMARLNAAREQGLAVAK